MRFFTSDLHFGHANVINYCQRPYANVEEMNEALIKQWNGQVTKDDIVYVVGDFSLSHKWSTLIVPQLNGISVLIAGNHDAPFEKKHNEKEKRMKAQYLADGWSEVVMFKMIQIGPYNVLMTHMPYANNRTRYDDRHASMKPNKGSEDVHAHGHLHCHYLKQGNEIDVGIDNNFKLYTEDDILSIIEDKREFIPSRLTEFYKERQCKQESDTQSKKTDY